MVALKSKSKSKGPQDSKRIKMSQAQQYMALAVLGASLFLGAAIAVVLKSIDKISFSANVIMAQDQSIDALSNTIRDIGICESPSGKVYSDQELNNCDPNTVVASSVPGTLKSNIIENMAANEALASVESSDISTCINPATEQKYTYKELQNLYNNAQNNDELSRANGLILTCSALRIIPDALPAFMNEEALLSSIDKIFRITGTEPESLAPAEGGGYSGGEDEGESGWSSLGTNLYTNPVNLSIESDAGTVNTFLDNIERSIRNIDIRQASIEWSGANTINFQATATAYYTAPSTITIIDKTISPGSGGGAASTGSTGSTTPTASTGGTE